MKKEIDAIAPVPEQSNNAKWGLFGFCGSLLISLLFYVFSGPTNASAIGIGIGLLIGLLIAAFAFGRNFERDREVQATTVARCRETIAIIEKRLLANNSKILSATDDQEELVALEVASSKNGGALPDSARIDQPKETLASIVANSKLK